MARGRVCRAVLRGSKKDPQAELVYLWENSNFRALFYGSRLPLPKAQKVARSMAKFCKVPEPSLTFKRKGKRGNTAEQHMARMWVNTDKAGWTHALLAHEIAHWVNDCRKVRGQDHGPVWMGVYLKLLDKFKVMPLHMTTYSARQYGIKVKPC